MELTAIPGVGAKTAEALAHLDDPVAAIESGDVATLATAPGITTSTAARIARAAIREKHCDEGTFLSTTRAEEIYADLLECLRGFAQTEYARRRIETFFPTSATERIEEVRALSARALDRTPNQAVIDALGDVELLDQPPTIRVRERCLATADAERYSRAREVVPELSTELVDSPRELADLAQGYTTVIALDEQFAGMDLDENVHVEPTALETPTQTVPERTLAFFATNRERIHGAVAVYRAADLVPPTDLDALSANLDRLGDDGSPIADPERDRLASAVSELDASVEAAERVANDRLRAAIRERDVTIEGSDLLSMVERGAGVESLLTHELRDAFEQALEAAREHLIETLRLAADERRLGEAVFPDQPAFPVASDEAAVGRLRTRLQTERDRLEINEKRALASDLATDREAVERLIAQALELDVELAIARFAETHGCTMPRLDGTGIEIEDGRSPLLDLPAAEVEPIDYDVDDVVLLSGVNSGGKTALLDLLAAIAILAHMGLPVPARQARLQRFEGIHYHAATQGTLDAGAFETTVRQFGELATGAEDRLVLVDELESITEPGAAAHIVAGILEELRGNAVGVVVSHLAAEIRDVADADLRIDGIEATGVVDGELVVNRTPIPHHHARSTPELIVERLAEEASGSTAAFYDRLLAKFE